MKGFPHVYYVSISAQADGTVPVASGNLPQIITAPPPEFDGPKDIWSPETLLVASAVDCFVLSWRGVAKQNGVAWHLLECLGEGTLDRIDRVSQFTEFRIHARLTLPPDGDAQRAEALLQRAKKVCLVTNSLKAETHLETEIVTEE